jgi:hypothetical protein
MVSYTCWSSPRQLLLIWRERHREKFIGQLVMQSLSMKLRVSCVYILLIVWIGMSFQSGSLKTMVLVNGHWSIRWPHWSYLERRILKLVPRFVMRPTEWLSFIHNGIWFFLLGRTNHCLHMTWTAVEFMSSLSGPSAILEIPENCYVLVADLTIFLIFPYSWSH